MRKTGLISRRTAIKTLGAVALGASAVHPKTVYAQTGASPRVVIIGGGAGGATLALSLRRQAPNISVTLIEPAQTYTTCFMSNWVLGGFRDPQFIVHSYEGLKQAKVAVVHDTAVDVDPVKRSVTLISGTRYQYDRLVLSPGIDLKYEKIEGYSRDAAQEMPHAWRAGRQTELLKQQLLAMPDNGVVVLSIPPDPYSCPPGPYERACMIAHILKTTKKSAKLIIFDAKKAFSKQAAFVDAFQKYYPGIIELNLTDEIDNFNVVSVKGGTKKTIRTESGREESADVANIIPAQRAAGIALRAGCVKDDWCPVAPETFASLQVPNVHVIGDAAVATEMPKSGYSANSHAKAVAAVLSEELAGQERFPNRLRNTCWSLVAPDDVIKIGANYTVGERNGIKRLIPSDGFVSEPGEDSSERQGNHEGALGWYSAMVLEMFGKV